MKRLSLLSTINKLNKFGISPIYQYGLNSTTLRNIITIQQRPYTSLSSTPPSSPPEPPSSSPSSAPSSAPSSTPPLAPPLAPPSAPTTTSTSENYQLKLSKAISTKEIKEKKLIVNEILQSDILPDFTQLLSRLILQLIEYDISLVLKIYDKYHNNITCYIENKKATKNQQEEKERNGGEIERFLFNKSQLEPFNTILKYYLRKQDYDGLEAFCMKYISEYGYYFGSRLFFSIVECFCKNSFERFTEFVFRLYDNKLLVPEPSAWRLSFSTMVESFAVQKYSNEAFNRLFNYHIERWGPITSEDASYIFEYLIATKDLKSIVKALNFIDSGIINTAKLTPHMIIDFFRVFSKSEKDTTILVGYQDLIFKQMKKLDPKEIAGIIFFYNLIIDNTHYQDRFGINKQFISRLHDEFLRTLPKETIKVIIDDLVKYFLSTNHYEKSLYWFNANSTIFSNEISKTVVFSFIAYHTSQLLSHQIEEKRIEEYCQFWRKTLKLSENETFNDKYLGMEESVCSEFKNLNPSEILKSIYNLPKGYEEILAQKVDYKGQLVFSIDYHNITLSAMLKNDTFKGSEIFHYLNDNFLNKSQLPVGTLLLDTILKIQSLDKRENQKEDKEQVDEKDEKVNESKDNKKSYISGYWENNDSGFSRLTNKEINFIQPMLKGIKNDLILDRDLFDERYVQMLSRAQQLSLLPELGKNEIQILRVTLLNVYFYKTEESMVEYLKIVIQMIKNHHTIPFDVFEQTCWLVLEHSCKLVGNGSVENITMLVDFIEKFTKDNPTFEIGHLVILNYLYSLQKYSQALSYIESNPNFRNTHDTLLIETKCLLQLDQKSINWREFFDRIESLKRFENLAFLFNPIITHFKTYPKELDEFENSVLTKYPYSTYLVGIDSRAFETLIYHHINNPTQWRYYAVKCLQPYQAIDFLFSINQEKNSEIENLLKIKCY
ncbi:hypothetical protein ACTFIR_003486 [Dictyostelium discoideum]